MKEFLEHPVFKIASGVSEETGCASYVVGGWVRDMVMGRPCKDIDILVVGNGIEFAEKVAARLGKNFHISVFKNFGTAQLKYNDFEIEFVGARKESYRGDSRKPQVEGGSFEDDLRRRDFTINTLAVSLVKDSYGELIDIFGGMEDISKRLIRTPLDPDTTYSDDPLRMMRGIRFCAQLQFRMDDASFASMCRNKDRILIVSRERIADELNRIILSPVPSDGFKLLFDTGILHLIFPSMAALHGVDTISRMSHKDNFYHTLEVLDNISLNTENLWLRWASVLHDIAKPATKRFESGTGWTFHGHEDLGARMVPRIFADLKLPLNEKMKYVQKLVLLHLRPIVLAQSVVTDSAIRRLLFEAGDDIDDLMTLCEADITTKNKDRHHRYLRNFALVRQKLREVEEKDKIRNWQPPVTGELIMKVFGIAPGREIGIIKTAIREAILEGEIKNEYQAAYELMLKKGTELGLRAVV